MPTYGTSVAPMIAGVGAYFPERVVTNDEVLGFLRDQSTPYLSPEDGAKLMENAALKLSKCGSVQRRWCAPDEWCTDIARKASVEALADADIGAEELDLIIYAGMARAFVEPATAHVLRSELKATNANVFDLGDACAGMIKALEVAGALIKTGAYKTILIATGERTYDWADFRCKTVDELSWKFGSLTVGDAAGALIVKATEDPASAEAPTHWRCFNVIMPDSYATCNIGLNHRIGQRYTLNSHSTRLFYQGREVGITLFQNMMADPRWAEFTCDNVFLHEVGEAVTATAFQLISQSGMCPKEANYRSFYAQHGNVATASLPLAMSYAKREERLKRGSTIAFYCPAAGVQAAMIMFRY